jgi:hypothetical protein
MQTYVAVVLICQMTVPQDACTLDSARDVISVRVEGELGCTNGWQDVVARAAFADDIGKTAYAKTLCRPLAAHPPRKAKEE